jgi:hypothetical protein
MPYNSDQIHVNQLGWIRWSTLISLEGPVLLDPSVWIKTTKGTRLLAAQEWIKVKNLPPPGNQAHTFSPTSSRCQESQNGMLWVITSRDDCVHKFQDLKLVTTRTPGPETSFPSSPQLAKPLFVLPCPVPLLETWTWSPPDLSDHSQLYQDWLTHLWAIFDRAWWPPTLDHGRY